MSEEVRTLAFLMTLTLCSAAEMLKEKQKERGGGGGIPSGCCGNLVGGVQLAGRVMGPCGPT